MMENDVLNHHTAAPLVYVKGTHREIGRQIGEAFPDRVRHSIENARTLIEQTRDQLQLTWGAAQIQAQKYTPFAQERYPQYIEELQGIAEGAGVSPEDLAVVNALEAVTMDALHLTKCTSIAVNQSRSADGHVLIGHNEDWLPEDEPDVFIIHAEPHNEPSFLAMTYGGLLPNIGFNAHGICQCCDSVYPNDYRIGLPRVIASRAVLAAKTIDQAIRAMILPLRAAGYNHLLAHESGELYNIEVSARHFSVIYAENGMICHTNHYLAPNMQTIESEPDELVSTRIRYFRALRLLREKSLHDRASLQAILSDHVNFPDAICNHDVHWINPMDREKTICSLIMDLSERKMYVAWGNPCANAFTCYQLTA